MSEPPDGPQWPGWPESASVPPVSWPHYWARLTQAVSQASDCTRDTVGAALVDPRVPVLVTASWNGARDGAVRCDAGGCPRGRYTHQQLPAGLAPRDESETCIGIHAEDRTLNQAKALGLVRAGMEMYVTRPPCRACAALLAEAEVRAVVFFICPRCAMVSFNPHDAEAGYCGACHDWTREAR